MSTVHRVNHFGSLNKLKTAAIVLGCGLFATPVLANHNCPDRAVTARVLGEQHQEQQRMWAAGSDEHGDPIIYEFWANAETGTWTLFRVDNEGQVCWGQDGTGFDFPALSEAPAPGEDS